MAGWRQPGRRSLKSVSVTGFLKVPYQSFVTGKSGAVIIAEGLSRQDAESGCRPEFLAAVENRDQSHPPPSDLEGQPQGASLNGRMG
jgi:hypothetical protein